MKLPLLDPACLPFYEWLDLPMWVFDAQHMRKTWANAAGLAYWRAATLEELAAREEADTSAAMQLQLALTMQAHGRGEVTHDTWTLRPDGQPVRCQLLSRGFKLDDGRQALLFIAERPPTDFDGVASCPSDGVALRPSDAVALRPSDIVESNPMQRSLELVRVAEDAARLAKTELIASVSHEVRTTLNSVLGLTELTLRDDDLSDRQRRFITLAHQSAKGLMSIVDDLLQAALLDAGQATLARAPFAVGACVADALASLTTAADIKGLRLGWRIDPAVPPLVLGNAVRLRQMLAQLVGNALRVVPAGGLQLDIRVDDEARVDPDQVALALTLRDTGFGMTPELLSRALEFFPSGDPHSALLHGDAGLGLTIMARTVALMGGEVGIDSAPGDASCFRVTWRMQRPHATPAWSAAGRGATAETPRPRA